MVRTLSCSKASCQTSFPRRARLAPAAVVVTFACCFGGWTATTFAAVATRPQVSDWASVRADDAPLPDAEKAAHRSLLGHTNPNVTAETAPLRGIVAGHTTVLQGPPCSTCFVETEETGRPVLEEWLLRGDASNVVRFRNWRLQSGSGPMKVRCEDAAVRAEDEVLCIECLSHQPAEGPSMRGAHTIVAVQGTFVGLQQCLGSFTGGMGFCKSGKVVMPF